MPKPRYDFVPMGDVEFAGRAGKYDAWVQKVGIVTVWFNGEYKCTIHSWEAWQRGHLSHWPPGLTARVNAIKGMLGYG